MAAGGNGTLIVALILFVLPLITAIECAAGLVTYTRSVRGLTAACQGLPPRWRVAATVFVVPLITDTVPSPKQGT